ncbi:hypothetical protein HDV05_000625, partial [Chytridiales sp. JEL 0842]
DIRSLVEIVPDDFQAGEPNTTIQLPPPRNWMEIMRRVVGPAYPRQGKTKVAEGETKADLFSLLFASAAFRFLGRCLVSILAGLCTELDVQACKLHIGADLTSCLERLERDNAFNDPTVLPSISSIFLRQLSSSIVKKEVGIRLLELCVDKRLDMTLLAILAVFLAASDLADDSLKDQFPLLQPLLKRFLLDPKPVTSPFSQTSFLFGDDDDEDDDDNANTISEDQLLLTTEHLDELRSFTAMYVAHHVWGVSLDEPAIQNPVAVKKKERVTCSGR